MIIELLVGGAILYMGRKKDETTASNPGGFIGPMPAAPQAPDLDYLFQKYGATYGVDWKILKAICMIESNLGRAASVARGAMYPNDVEGSKSSDGKSWGVMQMTIPTARDFDAGATPELLNNAEYSVALAARFFAWVQKQFPVMEYRYLEYCVKSYNQGVGRTQAMARGGPDYAGDYWTKFQKAFKTVG